jgi:hypothetical protein
MRLRLPLLLLLFITSSAWATWSPFSEPRRTGPAAYDQAAPVVASNGFDYLTAWTTVAFSPAYAMHAYAARVNANGTVDGTIATLLDTDAQFAHGVSVTQGRDGYFVAWMSEKGMTAAILDSFGRVERRTTVAQDDQNHDGRTIAAWNGAVHIVVSGFAPAVSATLLDDNGSVIASNIPIGDTHGEATSFAVVADSAGFLVLSTKREFSGDGYRDAIFGRYIATSGATGDWFLIRTVASAVSALTAVADGSRDVIAWSDQFGIWTMDFNPQLRTSGTARQLSPSGSARLTRIVRWQDRLWLAYQPFFGPSVVMPLNSDGSAGTPVTMGDGYQPEIATNGSSILSVRATKSFLIASNDVIGHFVTSNATDFLISRSQTDQQNGEVATNGTIALAIWDEEIGPNREVFAARFDSSGRAIDGSGLQLSAGGTNQRPSAAFDGHDWLIAWARTSQQSGTVVVARRVSAAGTVIDTEDIVLGAGSSAAPRTSSSGSGWIVAWTASRPGNGCPAGSGSATRVVVSRVSSNGVVLDPDGIVVAPDIPMDQTDADIGWNGSSFVAAWTNSCFLFHNPTRYSISGALIAPDLKRIDSVPLTGVASTAPLSKPQVAADARGSIVAWQRESITEYQLVDESSAPYRGRVRAVGTPRVLRSVEGSLVGAARSRTGEWMVFTRKKIPWAVNDGVFFSILGADGGEIGSGLGTILDADEFLMAHAVRTGSAFVPEARFDAAAGAQRLWMRTVDQ